MSRREGRFSYVCLVAWIGMDPRVAALQGLAE